MDTDFHIRNWTLELEPDVPVEIPVPADCPFSIQGIYATDTTAEKIVLESKIQIVRIDKIVDDVAPCEVVSPVLATVFPSINPCLNVNIEFTPLNRVSVRATGGKLVLSGIYDTNVE